MRKVVCFALLAVSALAAHSVVGARADLFLRGTTIVRGSTVVLSRPGQVGVQATIKNGFESFTYRMSIKVLSEGGAGGGSELLGTFKTTTTGRGAGTGFVAVDPAWDVNGDGVISVEITVAAVTNRNGAGDVLRSHTLTVKLR